MVAEAKDEWLKQITTLLLGAACPENVAVALSEVEEDLQLDFLLRLAKDDIMGFKTAELIAAMYHLDITALLGRQHQAAQQTPRYEYDGKGKIAKILMAMPSDSAEQLYQRLLVAQKELAAALASEVFFFNELAELPDRWLQVILHEYTDKNQAMKELALAVADLPAPFRNRFFTNLSSRQAAELRTEISYLPSQPGKWEIRCARRAIAAAALSLAAKGEIRVLRSWVQPIIRRDTLPVIEAALKQQLVAKLNILRQWPDKDLQALATEASRRQLARALMVAEPAVREKVIASRTERLGQLLQEEIDAELEKGVYLQDVLAAIKEILSPRDK